MISMAIKSTIYPYFCQFRAGICPIYTKMFNPFEIWQHRIRFTVHKKAFFLCLHQLYIVWNTTSGQSNKELWRKLEFISCPENTLVWLASDRWMVFRWLIYTSSDHKFFQCHILMYWALTLLPTSYRHAPAPDPTPGPLDPGPGGPRCPGGSPALQATEGIHFISHA